jgi:trk system potassium uptake protein
MIQLGGLGIMTVATLLLLLVARRIGLHLQLTAVADTRAVGLGEVGRVVLGVPAFSVTVELVTAIPLMARFALACDEPLGRSVYLGVFHAVSAFNNAGFALFTDNMMSFATDPWICLPLGIATILGGLGFPVLFEMVRRLRGRSSRWSLHVRVTVITTRSCSSSALPRSFSASGQPAHHRPGRYPWQDRDRDVPRDPTPHRRLQQHRHGPSRAVTLLITNVLM